ncbi:MAG: DUF1552 domain-containing protein [Planctomycetes bacterium]|nr:DUF1552 domain-containing protein [Planctomycetota bacterium]
MRLTRRTLLRGAGAAVSLPLLDAMLPRALGDGPPPRPLRLVFVFVPNGVHLPAWRPQEEGPLGALPSILEPLEAHRERLLVLSGLTLDGGRAHGDGPGDHARAAASFLTGAHPRKTGGADIQAGVSVDQVAATVLGRTTRFPSLELGTEPSAQSGACDSGYSCAYSSTIAWKDAGTPLKKESSPRRVFERLFGDGEALSPEERAARGRARRSVLDLAHDEARRLRARLGQGDRRKLDEFAESVREVERRLERAAAPTDRAPPPRRPADLGEHLGLLYDLTRLALETDQTRVVTIMAGNAGSNRSYAAIGVPEGHHDLSHHGRDPAKQEKLRRINRFHVERLAGLLDGLARTPDGDGTLLDSTLVVYGSGIADGDRHDHHDLPLLLCGGGARVAGGRHVRYPAETPLCGLYLWLLRRAGLAADAFGDATRPLPGLGG